MWGAGGDRGIEMLGEGIAAWQGGGARLWMPMFQMLQALAYAKASRSEPALKAIEQAISACQSSGERWAMAEVLRTKASLLARAGDGKRAEAEAVLLDSLDIAQRQEARSWQLRTACDLSRLWQRQGRNGTAHQLLQSVYDGFTEGFDTGDLLEAHTLLLALKPNLRWKRTDGRKYSVGTHRKT